jgi:hypothetical protein
MPINGDNNQNNNQNQQDQSQPVNLGGSGGVSPVNTGRTAAFSSGSQPQQKGSGRYTNLQKYLGANQGAGERLSSGIGSNINKETEKNTKEANTQASNIRAGIDSANQNLSRGQGYQQQLDNKDFNAQQFVADDNKLQDFSKFRTNQAIDQSGLQNQYNQALSATQNTQDALQNRQNQLGNEQGRFNLLKETFGGKGAARPNYSTGQQRLDQLFLQSGGSNNIGQLQNQLKSQGSVVNQNLNALQNDTQSGLQNTIKQAGDLSQGLQQKTGQMETGYITGLEGQVGSVNDQRNAQRAAYEKYINQLAGKVKGEALDPNLSKEFGLMQNQQLFNVPKNLNTYRDVVDVNDAQAQNYRDVANQEDVNQYGALAKLAGIGNDKLTQASTLAAAAKAKTGDEALQSRIEQAKQSLLSNAAGQQIKGYVRDEGKEYETGINALDFLNNSANGSGDVQDFINSSRNVKPATMAGGGFSTGANNDRMTAPGAKSNVGYYDTGTYNFSGRQFGNQNVRDMMRTAAVDETRKNALQYLANQGYFDVLGDTGGTQGSQNLSDYREGGVYTPKKLI